MTTMPLFQKNFKQFSLCEMVATALTQIVLIFEGGEEFPSPLTPSPTRNAVLVLPTSVNLFQVPTSGGGRSSPPSTPPPLLENVSPAKHLSSFSSTIWYHFMSCVHIFAGIVCPWKYKMLFHGNTKCVSMKSEISIGQK